MMIAAASSVVTKLVELMRSVERCSDGVKSVC